MRIMLALGVVAMLAAPLRAQGPGAFRGPPDHWMTFDSLTQAVGLTDAQKPDVQKHYDALNAVLKRAADERQAMRERMRAGGGPRLGGGQEMRERMQGMQTELEGHYTEIRNLLTAEQQAQLDALPVPWVMGGPRMMRPPGR